MTGLRLGPILRWVDETSATVWVETDEPATVEVLGHTDHTFAVAGHHYALVVVEGLTPGTDHPYEVRLDGQRVWPLPDSEFPQSSIRTLAEAGPRRLTFGSCRVAGPRTMPLRLDRLLSRYDTGLDALAALGQELMEQPATARPDLLLLLGDQVYADDPSPDTVETFADRHGQDRAVVADFEDYTTLYRDSWLDDPRVRWLLSTVPVAMMFDDHEVIDDWGISASWVEDVRTREGWDERYSGALMAYWVYQHLGNLSPQQLDEDELYRAVRDEADAADLPRQVLVEADREREGSRWAFRRDLGEARLLVLDTRATRVLEEGTRDMLDPIEWRRLEKDVEGARHLLLASSVPVVYAQGFHELQTWSERVTAGAWGRRAASLAEWLRRRLSLSGWPSFPRSLDRLMALLADLSAGRRGPRPESITLLSGDVHHGYVAALGWPDDPAERSPVHQVVTSPLRNPLLPHERLAQHFAASRFGSRLTARLARAAGAGPARFDWKRREGIDFANQVSTLEFSDGHVSLHTQAAVRRRGRLGLRTLWRCRLA